MLEFNKQLTRPFLLGGHRALLALKSKLKTQSICAEESCSHNIINGGQLLRKVNSANPSHIILDNHIKGIWWGRVIKNALITDINQEKIKLGLAKNLPDTYFWAANSS